MSEKSKEICSSGGTKESSDQVDLSVKPMSSAQMLKKKPIVLHLKQLNISGDSTPPTECLLCQETFSLSKNIDTFLTHLLCTHFLVIADIHCVADMIGYIDYWRTRLRSVRLEEICTTMHAAVKQDGSPFHVEGLTQEFYLLSDVLPEDRLLRQGLQEKRLEWVLHQQQMERNDTKFSRGCLFCRTVLEGRRAQYLDHLSQQHNLQLGRPHNLVFIDELIDTIEQYFNKLQCLFCDKIFKDRLVLREHMRKKMHKRINPNNHNFDKYYVVNYLEMGKDWVQVQQEIEEPEPTGYTSGSEAAEGDVADWGDWDENGGILITCLFCDYKHELWAEVLQHLKEDHNFNFLSSVAHLDFYKKVKLVNFIRHQIDSNQCITCNKNCSTRDDLNQHMRQAEHICLPDQHLWDQPEYYFPTLEADGFLCQLDDARDDGEGTPECVLSEEPHPELCEAMTESHINEVEELRATLSATSLPRAADTPQTSSSINCVSFK